MREIIQPENIHRLVEIAQLRCGWISDVRWSPSGDMLAVASGDTVRLYNSDVDSLEVQPAQIWKYDAPVKAIAFSRDGLFLASVGAFLAVYIWNLTALAARSPRNLTGHTDALNTVVFGQTARWIAAAGAEGEVFFWDMVESRTVPMKLGRAEGEIISLAFVPDDNLLISGSRDGTIRLSDVTQAAESMILGTHDGWVRALAISPDNAMAASASKDGTVRLWDIFNKTLMGIIQAHEGGVDCVSFSADGRVFATGGRDQQIRLWDVANMLEKQQGDLSDALLTLSAHTRPVMSLAFNPSGTLLVSGSGDNTVRIWGIT
jgi:WD40 repeat protein